MLKNISPTKTLPVSAMSGAVFGAVDLAPFFEAPGLAIDGDHNQKTPIAILNGSRCPSAVAGFIPTFVIDTVDGMIFVGPLTDMGQECLKVVSPFVANSDATPAIVFERRLVGVCAPRDDVFPNNVFWGAGLAVAAAERTDSLPLSATARFDVAKFEFSSGDDDGFPAIALGLPVSLTIANAIECGNGEPVNLHTDEIELFCHNRNIAPTSGIVNQGGWSC
jgi:hypothetical protein